MEQIIKMAKDVYERRISKTMELKEQENAERERIRKEAKELVKLVIRLFGASNKEKGDYRIRDIRLSDSIKNCNIFCMVMFERDKNEIQPYKEYSELINLPYISKAIDKINHQKYDVKVLYETMRIFSEIEKYRITRFRKSNSGEYGAKEVTFTIFAT